MHSYEVNGRLKVSRSLKYFFKFPLYYTEAHHFDAGIRVQRLCLTLLGETRLWYQSLELWETPHGHSYKIYLDKDIQN